MYNNIIFCFVILFTICEHSSNVLNINNREEIILSFKASYTKSSVNSADSFGSFDTEIFLEVFLIGDKKAFVLFKEQDPDFNIIARHEITDFLFENDTYIIEFGNQKLLTINPLKKQGLLNNVHFSYELVKANTVHDFEKLAFANKRFVEIGNITNCNFFEFDTKPLPTLNFCLHERTSSDEVTGILFYDSRFLISTIGRDLISVLPIWNEKDELINLDFIRTVNEEILVKYLRVQ